MGDYFDDMSRKELIRCLQYLNYKQQRGMNKQVEEDNWQRMKIMEALARKDQSSSQDEIKESSVMDDLAS